MTTVLIYAEERSYLPNSAPETGAIRAALSVARTSGVAPAAIPAIGNWVGDAPRVTRTIEIGPVVPFVGAIPVFVTRVAWPYEWDDARWPGVDPSQLASWLKERVTRVLKQDSSNWLVFDPKEFNAQAYGELDWWRSGAAATTPTFVNTWPTIGHPDNPTGPNGPRPQGYDGVIRDIASQAAREAFDQSFAGIKTQAANLWPVALIAGLVVVGVYLGPPLIAAATAPSVSSKPTAPSNRGSSK